MGLTREEQDEIRAIVREEIALDELRRVEAAPPTAGGADRRAGVPGGITPPPGTLYFAAQEAR